MVLVRELMQIKYPKGIASGCVAHACNNAATILNNISLQDYDQCVILVNKTIQLLFNTALHQLLREALKTTPSQSVGKPISTNSLQWLHTITKLEWMIKNKCIIRTIFLDERSSKYINDEISDFVLQDYWWSTMKELQIYLEIFQCCIRKLDR